jgi:hypothetical protein
MQNAVLTILLLYWPQLLIVAAACFLLLLYGAYIEPQLVKKGILKERFDEMSRDEAVKFIDRLLNDSTGGRELEIEDFISTKYRDPLITELANYVGEISFPVAPWTEKQLHDFQEFKSRLATPEIENS